jgi:transcriptional enhancer factor
MELLLPQQQQNQQQRSCVLSTYVPAIAHAHTAALATQRGILQERSANWPHEYNTQSTSIKLQSRSPSPTEHKHVQRPPAAGNYFTGNIHGQQIGLAGFGEERSEKQVEYELNRLYLMLQRSDKYQKYREKQPVLTAAEFLAREAAEQRLRQTSGDKSAKDGKDDKAVWPEFLEHAFWRGKSSASHPSALTEDLFSCDILSPLCSLQRRKSDGCRTNAHHIALVKWPPMGRKKYMLDGALRGRNELIQDSIRRDTGIKRDRKQVSSHLQVLKQHLRDHHRGKYTILLLHGFLDILGQT